MPSERTEVTEIVTGLAMLGHTSLDRAIGLRPPEMVNVGDAEWERLTEQRSSGAFAAEFEMAWSNGRTFLQSERGLRRRPPLRVEWKGYQRPPAYERIPADLRVDHVFLISCKYLSNILSNSAPAVLFDRALIDRDVERGLDWYFEVAPDAYQDLYDQVRSHFGLSDLPDRVDQVEADHRTVLRGALSGRSWPSELQPAYEELATTVSAASAKRWRRCLGSLAEREEMLWRLLRLQSAPYFVLGSSSRGPLRIQVVTPWDWRQSYRLIDVEIEPTGVGQPRVAWRALIEDRELGAPRTIEGHVEIRWSHGRFNKVPEAKVYLDTPQEQVGGYEVLPDR